MLPPPIWPVPFIETVLSMPRVASHVARAHALLADFRAEIQSCRELLAKASLTKSEEQEAVCDALESMEQVLVKNVSGQRTKT